MRYVLYVLVGEWRKLAEYDAMDAIDALTTAARTLMPDQHDKPILLQPTDRPGPEHPDQ